MANSASYCKSANVVVYANCHCEIGYVYSKQPQTSIISKNKYMYMYSHSAGWFYMQSNEQMHIQFNVLLLQNLQASSSLHEVRSSNESMYAVTAHRHSSSLFSCLSALSPQTTRSFRYITDSKFWSIDTIQAYSHLDQKLKQLVH